MTNRWDKLVERMGSEEKAREEMRRRAAKSSRNAKGTGGFAYLKLHDPDKFKEITSRGGKAGTKKD